MKAQRLITSPAPACQPRATEVGGTGASSLFDVSRETDVARVPGDVEQTLTVLLVEPHGETRDMYAEFLRYRGVRVRTVSTAAEALASLSKLDVLVTNIMLPGEMDGLDFIVRLRRDEPTKHTPIVVVSACVFPGDRQRAHDAGCDVFLAKPCLPNVLLDEVHRLARTSRLRQLPRTFVTPEETTLSDIAQRSTRRPA